MIICFFYETFTHTGFSLMSFFYTPLLAVRKIKVITKYFKTILKKLRHHHLIEIFDDRDKKIK